MSSFGAKYAAVKAFFVVTGFVLAGDFSPVFTFAVFYHVGYSFWAVPL